MKRVLFAVTRFFRGVNGWLLFSAPLAMLLMRLWVADAFFRAGLVKIANMQSTISLFTYVYHTPILSPTAAAYTGTFVELVLPVFLAFGLLGRYIAGILFIYNIVAVVSYPDIWASGFTDHQAWGLMLLAIALYGPGRLSLDHLIARLFGRDGAGTFAHAAHARLNRWLAGLFAALAATTALSAVLILKTFLGELPALDPAKLVGRVAHVGVIGGWAIFLAIAILAWGLVFVWVYPRLPGRPAARGALFGAGVWLLVMLVLAPLAGAGLFAWRFGWIAPAFVLVFDLMYGAILGAAYARLAGGSPADPATAV